MIIKHLFFKYIVLIRYFFIGISAAGLDLVIYFVLFNYINWNALVSTTISVSVATIYAFVLNAVYNFRVKGKVILRLLSYSFVSGVGLLISVALLYVFTDVYGYDGNLVKVLSLPVIFLVQYLLNKNITFAQEKVLTSTPNS